MKCTDKRVVSFSMPGIIASSKCIADFAKVALLPPASLPRGPLDFVGG